MVFQNIKNDGIRSQTMNKLLDIRNCAFHYKVMIDDFPDGLTGLMRLTPSERLREYIVDLLLCTPRTPPPLLVDTSYTYKAVY